MALDLRDLLREGMRPHPRVAQQKLFSRSGEAARIAAALPPLVAFGGSAYEHGLWIVDWDHRLPSRQAVLRLYACYTVERRRQLEAAYEARVAEMSREDLFPEFDVSDFIGLPADEAYEADLDLGGSPARMRLVSDWRREIQAAPATSAIEIVRASEPFRELFAALGRIAGIQAEHRLPRRQPMIPIDDPQAVLVGRATEGHERRQRGRDARGLARAREQLLLRDARM